MKTPSTLILTAVLSAAVLMSARAQTPPNGTPDDGNNNNAAGAVEVVAPAVDVVPAIEMPAAPDATNAVAEDSPTNAPTAQAPQVPSVTSAPAAAPQPTVAVATNPPADSAVTDFAPPAQASGTNSDELRLNFRNAPLEMVLNYLSDAAGFIIVEDTPVRGTVNVISSHPMTKDEAVDLLNSVLNKNGYAAIRDGRTLTIVSKESAKTSDIPVKVNNDPDTIPKNDEIVTQVIPIRFVEARQLVSDLSTFVSPQATIVANEAGNSIVVTDTQANIRHLTEIIRAIDSSAESETEIRVFRLRYANPTDVANLLGGIFPSSSSGNNTQTPIRFGGFGGFFGGGGRGGFGGGRGGGNTSSSDSTENDRIKKAQQVIAVADLRTSSVVVTAAKDLMTQIDGMIHELDVDSSRDQKVYVFHMDNGDPQQAVQVLQNMFQTSSTTRSGSSSSASQNSALMQRAQNNNTTTSSSSSSSGSSYGPTTGGRSGGGQLF